MSVTEHTVRFGMILRNQDFTREGSPHIWRRTNGRFAQPVQYIGGHASYYGGSECLIDLAELVIPFASHLQPTKEIDHARNPLHHR